MRGDDRTREARRGEDWSRVGMSEEEWGWKIAKNSGGEVIEVRVDPIGGVALFGSNFLTNRIP